jgi:uncharacterized membrane protein
MWMTLASTGWLALLLIAPVGWSRLAAFAYLLGGIVCHQLPARSFHLADAQLAVCARCTGIYAGAAAAFLWQSCWLVWSGRAATVDRGELGPWTARVFLIAGAAPTLMMVLLESLGFWTTSNSARALAGVPLGVVIALVAGRAATLHYGQWRRRRLV